MADNPLVDTPDLFKKKKRTGSQMRQIMNVTHNNSGADTMNFMA